MTPLHHRTVNTDMSHSYNVEYDVPQPSFTPANYIFDETSSIADGAVREEVIPSNIEYAYEYDVGLNSEGGEGMTPVHATTATNENQYQREEYQAAEPEQQQQHEEQGVPSVLEEGRRNTEAEEIVEEEEDFSSSIDSGDGDGVHRELGIEYPVEELPRSNEPTEPPLAPSNVPQLSPPPTAPTAPAPTAPAPTAPAPPAPQPPQPTQTIPFPRIKPSLPSTVVVNLQAVTSALHFEVTRRHLLRRWLYSVLYFALVVAITVLQANIYDTYLMGSLMEDTLVNRQLSPGNSETGRTLREVDSVENIHTWLHDVWAPGLFTSAALTATSATSQVRVSGNNVIIMTPYIKVQRRTRTTSCYGSFLRTTNSNCHDGGSTNQYTVFTTNTATDVTTGKFAGATSFDALSLTTVQNTLTALKGNAFITNEVLQVEVFSAIYNPYFDLVATFPIFFKIESSGGVTPMSRGTCLQIRRLDMHNRSVDTIRFVLELVFIVWTIVDSLFKFTDIRRARRRGASVFAYFSSRTWIWNLFEIFHVLIALCCFALYTRLLVEEPELPDEVYILDSRYNTKDTLYAVSKGFNSLLIAIAAVKVVRHMGFIPGWFPVIATLQRMVPWLASLIAFLIVMSSGFAMAGYIVFAPGAVDEFLQPGTALQSVLSFLLRDLPYSTLTKPGTDITNGVFPPILYWSMLLSIGFISLGISFAIAFHSHSRAREEYSLFLKYREIASEWQSLAPRQGWWWRIPGSSIFDRFPKDLIEIFGRDGKRWLLPLLVDHPATSKLVAEVGGGTLRIYIKVHDWFKRKLVGARGVAIMLPPGSLDSLIGKYHQGSVAKVKPGQAPHLTTEPLTESTRMEFSISGDTIRTRGGVDLGVSGDGEVVLEFPHVLNEQYIWPKEEVVASADTVQRIALYGGCFSHTPADWIACAVALPTALDVCPYLIREVDVPVAEILTAVHQCDAGLPPKWKHSLLSLLQMFSHTEEFIPQVPMTPRVNPLNADRTLPHTPDGVARATTY